MAADTRTPLDDAEARHRAATDFDTNLVVLAGAGTGKTSLLVERALNALGDGVASMDSIAAITFTEKAAGEMRERLAVGLDRLRALAQEEGELDDSQEADRAYAYLTTTAGVERDLLARRCLAAMEHLDHGSVVTIHTFCAELLRAHPIEAGVDPGFAVDAGQWAESLGRECWEEFVQRELGPGAEHVASWERLLATFSLSQVGEIARRLARFAVPARLLEPEQDGSALEVLRAEARWIAERIDPWLARSADLTDLGQRCLRGLRDALELLGTAGLVACQAALLADQDLADRVAAGKKGIGGARSAAGETAREEVKRIGEEARVFCRGLLRIEDEAFGLLVRVTKPFVEDYRERYLRRGLVGFDGLLALARDLLRDRPEIRRRVKRRFRMLLVDEFQDTDPMQYDIVLFLAEHSEEDARDPFSARLVPGRLFVVGDAKQSIYRFRGADFTAYSRAVERIREAGGEKLELVGNFRSVPGIVDGVNELFDDPRGSWQESDYQPTYVPIRPVRAPDVEGPAVDVWTVALPDGTKADERREAEGRVIADAVERWTAGGEAIELQQITLLFRACTHLPYYLRALRERGIPFVVDGGRDFLDRPEVAQLMATLRAISRPADQPSLLAYLRSPAGATSDVELARYAREDPRWDWRFEPDAERFPNLAHSFRVLRELWDETRAMPADRFVRRVLQRTAMLPLGALAFEGPQRVANLQKLAAAVAELARDGTLSLEEVIDAIEQGRLEEIETDRPLADDEAEAVRITNIHRMKGLENDVVIVPDLARLQQTGRDRSEPVSVPTLPDGSQALALKAGELQTSARLLHGMEDRRHSESEEIRVLYVALTRACKRLVLVAGKPRGPAPWLDALRSWGYEPGDPPPDGELLAGGRVRHRVLEPAARRTPAEPAVPEAMTRAVEAYEAAVTSLRAGARPPLAAPSRLGEGAEPAAAVGPEPVDSESGPSRALGLAVGDVMHRLLAGWDGEDPARLAELLGDRCAAVTRARGADRSALERAAREVLDAFLASGLPARLARLERLGVEVPVLSYDQETARALRGKIDLLYRDANGEIVVADYKTDRRTDRDLLRRDHGPQLAAYADAVRRALDLPEAPRTELWMLRAGEIVPLKPDDS